MTRRAEAAEQSRIGAFLMRVSVSGGQPTEDEVAAVAVALQAVVTAPGVWDDGAVPQVTGPSRWAAPDRVLGPRLVRPHGRTGR